MSRPFVPSTSGPTAPARGAAGTLSRMNVFGSTKQSKKCRNCLDSSVIIVDNHSGDELCSRCGLVLESRILCEEQEWRSFSNTDGGSGVEKSRVGGPNDAWLESGVKGTAMMGGDKKHSRLLQTHEMATATGGSDRLLKTAFGHLRNIAEFFNLRDNVVERCKEIVKDLQTADNLKSRTGHVNMLAVIYLACREEQAPLSLKELATYDRALTEKEISKKISKLKKLLPPRVQQTTSTAAQLMPRVCSQLQLSKEITNAAEYVARKAELCVNKQERPNSVAAGAVYLVTQICGLDIDPAEIAAIAKTGTAAVRQVYREMLPISNQLLPPDFNLAQINKSDTFLSNSTLQKKI